jgi:hypothetical protein
MSLSKLTKGTFIKATKLTGKEGAGLREGQTFVGTLQSDVSLDKSLHIDAPGMDWLVTSAVTSVVKKGDVYTVRTANSVYEVKIVPNEVPGIKGAKFV